MGAWWAQWMKTIDCLHVVTPVAFGRKSSLHTVLIHYQQNQIKLTLQFTGWSFSKPLVFFCCSILKCFPENQTTHWEQIPQNKVHETNLEFKEPVFHLTKQFKTSWTLITFIESQSVSPSLKALKTSCTQSVPDLKMLVHQD